MISALLYLQWHSLYNRLAARLKRLKQPKYLFGAIVGGVYFYWYFFRYLFTGFGHPAAMLPAAAPETLALLESIGALILAVVVLVAWIVPGDRAALTFSEAEVCFLFPAPVTRRTLIHFKLFRSQVRILLTTFILTLVSNRFGGNKWIHAAGWFLIFSTMNLHLIGASFARTMLLDRGITNRQRRLIVLGLAFIALATVGVWAARTLPLPADLFHRLSTHAAQQSGTIEAKRQALLNDLADYGRRVFTSGPMPWILYPFRILPRVFLAPDAAAFWSALWPALLLLAAHYAWVIRSDVAFEEASVDASRKLADRIHAARSGRSGLKLTPRRAPFNLARPGPRATALMWKNLILAGQAVRLRVGILLAAVLLGPLIALSLAAHNQNWLTMAGILSAAAGFWAVVIGPRIARVDLRRDLPNADVLKAFPLPGWQMVLGEILAPAVILTVIQWILILADMILFFRIQPGLSIAIGLGAAMVVPVLNTISLLIPNASVLLFPAWVRTGKDDPRGIEATGQRLILAVGQMLALAIALLPASAVSALVFFVVKMMSGPLLAVLAASVVGTLGLAGEAALGVALLGGLFDRLDLSAETGS
jgi:hypothetical protein